MQIRSDGATTFANGLHVVTQGMSISSNLVVQADGAYVNEPTRFLSGSVSVVSGTASGSVLDVYATPAGFTGNVIEGRFTSGTGIALRLAQGATNMFRVRFLDFRCTLARLYIFSKPWLCTVTHATPARCYGGTHIGCAPRSPLLESYACLCH